MPRPPESDEQREERLAREDKQSKEDQEARVQAVVQACEELGTSNAIGCIGTKICKLAKRDKETAAAAFEELGKITSGLEHEYNSRKSPDRIVWHEALICMADIAFKFPPVGKNRDTMLEGIAFYGVVHHGETADSAKAWGDEVLYFVDPSLKVQLRQIIKEYSEPELEQKPTNKADDTLNL